MLRKMAALLLASVTALALFAGCGRDDPLSSFRTLEVVGSRQYSLIYRKDDRLATIVDAAMGKLGERGVLASLSVRYLGRDAIDLTGGLPQPSPTPAPTPEPDAEEPDEAAQEAADAAASVPEDPLGRVLIVGVEQDFDPMAFEENGVLRGMNVDIASALAGEIGCKVTYQFISPAQVEAQLASGNIDVALGFDSRTVNADKFSVGYTYMESEIVLAARRGSGVNSVTDIKDRRIGTMDDPSVTAAVSANERILRYASGATVYLSPRRCVNALDKGWCAAIAMDVIMLEHAL